MKRFYMAAMLLITNPAFGQGVLRETFGQSPQAYLGYNLAALGDINGDGVSDYCFGHGLTIFVVSGVDGRRILNLPLGVAPSRIGDIDGDGMDDLVTTAQGAQSPEVRIVSSVTGSVLLTVTSPRVNTAFGTTVLGVGDLDSDTVADFLVTELWHFGGTVHAYSGANGALLYSMSPLGIGEFFGSSMDNLGDVDGDGVDDFVIGRPGQVWDHGAAYIYSGEAGQLIGGVAVPTGSGPWYQLGTSVANAGDQNGDGVNDVIAGAPHNHNVNGPILSGAVVSSGLDGSTIHVFPARFSYERYGSDVANAGDVNGDGIDDLLVSAYHLASGHRGGRIDLYSGQSGQLLYNWQGANGGPPGTNYGLGAYVAGLGDLNGDGYGDILMASSDADLNAGIPGSGVVWVISGGFADLAGTAYCQSSVNSSGVAAELVATGSLGAQTNNFALALTGAPEGQLGYFLASRGQGLVANPGGSAGTLCLGGGQGIARLHASTLRQMQLGELFAQIDLQDIPAPPLFHAQVLAGEQWNFQAWFRDGGTSNFSNGLSVVFQ